MRKHIAIIGGGISGLAVLHYLKQKYPAASDVQINLFEKEGRSGGVIQSSNHSGCLFESGPNGILDSKEQAMALIRELGLEGEILRAAPAAKLRFIAWRGRLHALPANPAGLLTFSPLSLFDKLRLFWEPCVPGRPSPEESVYDFGRRRFGKGVAEILLDCLAKGIYGADIRRMSLKAAFPLLYDLESKHGSVLKGLMALMKQRKQALPPGKPRSSPFGQLCSFRRGMQQLPQEIYSRYQHHIHLGEDVMGMKKEGGGYVIETPKVKYFADQVFICTPAYTAARLIADANAEVCGLLKKIEYVPILVAGLVYHTKDLKKIPEGFGYLVPTEGNSEILGVLFSGNIFPGHTEPEKFLFRVLIRPGRPDIDPRTFLPTAIEEVRSRFSITADPVERCYSYLAHAIPLYGLEHPRITEQLAAGMRDLPNCHLAGNYLGGISVADCIQNTKGLVEESDG